MKTFFSILILSLFLVACGTEESDDANTDNTDNSNEGTVTLNSIAGLYAWDFSEDDDQGYTLIESDGSVSSYDYYRDSFDGLGNNFMKLF
jgi:hypothetical protein